MQQRMSKAERRYTVKGTISNWTTDSALILARHLKEGGASVRRERLGLCSFETLWKLVNSKHIGEYLLNMCSRHCTVFYIHLILESPMEWDCYDSIPQKRTLKPSEVKNFARYCTYNETSKLVPSSITLQCFWKRWEFLYSERKFKYIEREYMFYKFQVQIFWILKFLLKVWEGHLHMFSFE